MTTDTSLLTRYGYRSDPNSMLRYHLWDDGDLYVISGSCILGKRVGSDYYLAGPVLWRPVSRNYWLRNMREWAYQFTD